MIRLASFSLTLVVSALCTACVFAPPAAAPVDSSAAKTPTDAGAVAAAKMSEQAIVACGIGNVHAVDEKSYACNSKMSEQAVAACGRGFVREVNEKNFTCK